MAVQTVHKTFIKIILLLSIVGWTAAETSGTCTSPGIVSSFFSFFSSPRSCTIPPSFPPGIPVSVQQFQNWDQEFCMKAWRAIPKTYDDIVALSNWAAVNNYQIRPSGYQHTWSPVTVSPKEVQGPACQPIILVDTTTHLTQMKIITTLEHPALLVQAGASMDSILLHLKNNGYTLSGFPCVGDITIGGALAIDGHGTGIPAQGETRPAGQPPLSTISNLVLEFEAVVWNGTKYTCQSFSRQHSNSKYFMTNLGLTFLTKVLLRLIPDSTYRCQSLVNIPVSELYANPKGPGYEGKRSIETFLNKAGRIDSIHFAFTESPWLKVWTPSPVKPASSRQVDSPYNYPFYDQIPLSGSLTSGLIRSQQWYMAPLFDNFLYGLVNGGLMATASSDIWGKSMDTFLYIRNSTIKFGFHSWAILTSRSNCQQILYDLYVEYDRLLELYRGQFKYPVNIGTQIRITEVDHDFGQSTSLTGSDPALSAARPVKDHPEYDIVIWYTVLTLVDTPWASNFLGDFEGFLYNNYAGGQNSGWVRPEWSKGFAFQKMGSGATGTWRNETVLKQLIPKGFDDWDEIVGKVGEFDPYGIYRNEFLNKLFSK